MDSSFDSTGGKALDGEDSTPNSTVKQGRVDGHNSPYKAGQHGLKPKIRLELVEIFREHIATGARGQVIGSRTIEMRKEAILVFFKELAKLHYKIESVYSIKQKHIRVVYQHLEAQGHKASTLQNAISHIRVFCEWIGKPGMVTEARDYVSIPESVKRTMVVQKDKSWEGNGVNVHEMIETVRKDDPKIAAVMMLCIAFGLRRKEALAMNIFKAVEGNTLMVIYATKGGRARSVPIEHDWQWEIIRDVKSIADQHTGRLMARGKTMQQSVRRVGTIMEKYGLTEADLGVTLHGLRHQYMHERYKEMTGIEPPVRGGNIYTLSREEFNVATGKLMERSGHTRLSIGASYYGSRRRRKPRTASQQDNGKSQPVI